MPQQKEGSSQATFPSATSENSARLRHAWIFADYYMSGHEAFFSLCIVAAPVKTF
jgi:hypothetical protein